MVDDLDIIIEGLEALLSKSSGIVVVGTAKSGFDAVEQVAELRPDVVLMDISMPGMDGIDATQEIKALRPATKVLILSMYDMPDVINDALVAGVDGFLMKNTGRLELTKAIQTIVEGGSYLSAKVQEGLDQHKLTVDYTRPRPLSKREKEVVKLVLREMTTQEIARKLFLSPATVETHRRNILDKLQVRNTAGLVKYAVERGW